MERGTADSTFRPAALSHIPAGPDFTHNPYVESTRQCVAGGNRVNRTRIAPRLVCADELLYILTKTIIKEEAGAAQYSCVIWKSYDVNYNLYENW